MKKTIFKLSFILIAFLSFTACNSDDSSDATTGTIEGLWHMGRVYGTGTGSGFNVTFEGDSEGTINFKPDGTYDSDLISGYVTVSIPALNQSQTTPIEPVAESGTYSYNAATDDVVIDGETSKVVLLNANSMKIKSYVNQDGVTAEIYSEYNR